MASLEGWSSTIELHPQPQQTISRVGPVNGGRRRRAQGRRRCRVPVIWLRQCCCPAQCHHNGIAAHPKSGQCPLAPTGGSVPPRSFPEVCPPAIARPRANPTCQATPTAGKYRTEQHVPARCGGSGAESLGRERPGRHSPHGFQDHARHGAARINLLESFEHLGANPEVPPAEIGEARIGHQPARIEAKLRLECLQAVIAFVSCPGGPPGEPALAGRREIEVLLEPQSKLLRGSAPCGWPAMAFARYGAARSAGWAVATGVEPAAARPPGQCRLSCMSNQPHTCASRFKAIRLWRMSSSWFHTGRPARSSIVGVVRVCSRKLKPSRLPDHQVALNDAVRAAGEGDAGLGAPGAGGRREAVADDDIVVRVQARRRFRRRCRRPRCRRCRHWRTVQFVLPMSNQMPLPRFRTNRLRSSTASRHSTSLSPPASQPRSNPLVLLFSTRHSVNSRRWARLAPKPIWPLSRNTHRAHDGIFAEKARSFGVHGLHHAVLQRVVPSGQNHRPVLGHVGGVTETRVRAARHGRLPRGSISCRTDASTAVRLRSRPPMSHTQQRLVRHVREEGPRCKLGGLEHLAQKIAIHRHLFTAADQAVIRIVGVGQVAVPGDEPVRPGHAVDRLRRRPPSANP